MNNYEARCWKLESLARVVTVMVLMMVFFVVILTVIPGMMDGHCYRHKDCYTCVKHRTWTRGPCNWCPLDNACHAKWSPKNDCLKRHNIRRHDLCPKPQVVIRRRKIKYDPEEAYKLAKFSAMAYSSAPEECFKELYPTWNVSDFYINRQECDDFLFDYDRQCLAFLVVHHDEREMIVSYRGTRGNKQVLDQVLTILGTPSIQSGVGGKVQRYFDNVYDRLYGRIRRKLMYLLRKYPEYTVKFTGHSLGGATASITSAILVKENILKRYQVFLYTFGMPRVGNKDFAEAHDNLVPQSFRVVREGDKVARFPPCRFMICSGGNGPYHHKRKILYTTTDMTVNSSYIVCKGNEDSNSKCKATGTRHRRGILDKALNVHKSYFNIPIGTYCIDHVLKP